MPKKLLLTGLVIASIPFGAPPAYARKLENWPYERLFKEADIVVIAAAKSTTPTDDRFKDNPWKIEFLGQTTTLAVKTILKGKAGDSIKVLHYRLKEGTLIEDGPLLVTFRTKPLLVEGKAGSAQGGAPEYLLFLKARKDGRFEPVSGQVDPELSVREIYRPLPDLAGNAEAGTKSKLADGQVIVITASYPRATARMVEEDVAAPIEQMVNGVAGMVRMESESGNDGSYLARLHFGPNADRQVALQAVQNRVAVAQPGLPNVVKLVGVTVKLAEGKADSNQLAIALVDRKRQGQEALQKWADAVMKRLAKDGVLIKTEAFPRGDEKQTNFVIDREQCAKLGLGMNTVFDALEKAAGAKNELNAETLKNLAISSQGKKIPLAKVVTIEEKIGPTAFFHVDGDPAIRITGIPPKGKSVAETMARCIELAEAELKRIGGKGFAVERLSGK